MELWIRSQDRECLMKIDRIDLDADFGNGEYKIMVNGYKTLVGAYKTKKRALEILDEIQRYIEKNGMCEIRDGKINGWEHFHTEYKVYEMPKE